MAQPIRLIVCGVVAATAVSALSTGAPDRSGGFISHARAADASVSGNGITLQAVSVDLPDSVSVFPGGKAADIVNANCTACHSPGMVLTQPALTQAQWQAEANKMRNDFKAPIDEKDVPAIVAYLVEYKGRK